MKNRFDLEQEIMDCWGVVEDIDIVYHAHRDTSDELANVLLGLKTLYQLKFDRLFSTFEDCVKQRLLEGNLPEDNSHWTDVIREDKKER